MMMTLILIVFALAAVLVLLRAARGRRHELRDLQDLEAHTHPVDLPAFRNLVDPAEEDYLRQHLMQRDFRPIQRQRMLAALDYVHRTADNAAVLLRLGEAARRHADPEVVTAGRQLANNALRLRINAMLAMGVLHARILLPTSHISVGHVIEIYESLTEGAVRLARLQNPAYAARITAAI